MQRLIELFKNKYFLISSVFLVWMIFFDRNDLFSQYQYRQQLNHLQQARDFYQKQTTDVTTELNELSSSKAELEKFAREKYLMKKPNEDVFLVVKEKKSN